jgi:hypothetical protein
MADEDGTLDIDLLAASFRADSSDVHVFVETLAAKLEEAVPGRVRVERRRQGMRGPKVVRKIAVDGGDQRLELRADGSAIETVCARVSGGIVLKNEQVSTDEWLAALGVALAAEAKRNATTRQALERLLTQ